MNPEAIIKEARAAGVNLVLSLTGTIKATGDQVAVDRWLPILKEHKPELLIALARPNLSGISPEFAARLSAEDLEDIATGDIPLDTVQAFEQAAIAREAEDLRKPSRSGPASWSSTLAYQGPMPSSKPRG